MRGWGGHQRPLAGATISEPRSLSQMYAADWLCLQAELVVARWCRENVIANTRAMQQRAWQQVAAEHSLPWSAGERNIYDIRPERAITEVSLGAASSGTYPPSWREAHLSVLGHACWRASSPQQQAWAVAAASGIWSTVLQLPPRSRLFHACEPGSTSFAACSCCPRRCC